MTDHAGKTLTSSGFYVSQEAPIHTDDPIATPVASPPDEMVPPPPPLPPLGPPPAPPAGAPPPPGAPPVLLMPHAGAHCAVSPVVQTHSS